jgi:AcrR family transcriptional regulator
MQDIKPTELNIKTAKRQNSELAILGAAQKLFAEKGFEATTSKEIAQTANVAEGLIFKYFKDKKGLLKNLMQQWFDKNINELVKLPSYPDDLVLELTTILHWTFNSYHKNYDLHKIAMANRLNACLHSELEGLRNDYMIKRMQVITSKLETHKLKGHISNDINIQQLYEVMQAYAMTETLFLNIKPSNYPKLIQNFINLLLNGIR